MSWKVGKPYEVWFFERRYGRRRWERWGVTYGDYRDTVRKAALKLKLSETICGFRLKRDGKVVAEAVVAEETVVMIKGKLHWTKGSWKWMEP